MVIDYTGNVASGQQARRNHFMGLSYFVQRIAVGKNDNLNLLVIGYDNTNNIGALVICRRSASSLTLNATGGNVGIGKTNPTVALDVVAASMLRKYQR